MACGGCSEKHPQQAHYSAPAREPMPKRPAPRPQIMPMSVAVRRRADKPSKAS